MSKEILNPIQVNKMELPQSAKMVYMVLYNSSSKTLSTEELIEQTGATAGHISTNISLMKKQGINIYKKNFNTYTLNPPIVETPKTQVKNNQTNNLTAQEILNRLNGGKSMKESMVFLLFKKSISELNKAEVSAYQRIKSLVRAGKITDEEIKVLCEAGVHYDDIRVNRNGRKNNTKNVEAKVVKVQKLPYMGPQMSVVEKLFRQGSSVSSLNEIQTKYYNKFSKLKWLKTQKGERFNESEIIEQLKNEYKKETGPLTHNMVIKE